MEGQTFMGVIKNFNPGSGYGFVECEETHAQYNGDVFLHKSVFIESGCAVGQEVSFQIELSDKGQPRARNMEAVGEAPEGALTAEEAAQRPLDSLKRKGPGMMRGKGGMGGMGMMGGMGGGMGMGGMGGMGGMMGGMGGMNMMGMGGMGGMGMGGGGGMGGGCRTAGQIVRFNQEKGYGFIECTEMGCDIFVHHEEASGFAVGDMVMFTVSLDPGSNKPRASNLCPAGMNPMMAMGKGGKGKGKGKNMMNREYIGEIKTINQKGFAFIGSEEIFKMMGRDIFLPGRDVEENNLQVGEEVAFKIVLDNGGKPQAEYLGRPGEMQAAGTAAFESVGEGPHQGMIKSFNEVKGYGFIECQPTFEAFNQDVFFHKEEFRPVLASGGGVGCTVEFSISLNNKGKPQANSMSMIGEAPEGFEPEDKRQQVE